MSIVKKTYNFIIKSVKRIDKCVNCNRTEKQLVGDTSKSDKCNSIFSTDSLCIDCEIRMYPDRFHGCGFCKRPIRERFSCVICSDGFIEWIKNVIQPIDSLSMMIRQSANGLLDRSIHDLPIDHHKFIVRNDDGYYRWPGFYAGITNKFSAKSSVAPNPTETKISSDKYDMKSHSDYTHDESKHIHIDSEHSHKIINRSSPEPQTNCFPVWIIPKLTKEYDINFSNLRMDLRIFQTILLELLEKNNINLYEDVQIDLDKMENEQIKTINPYDTRVMKKFF